jgi:hypothetical protein
VRNMRHTVEYAEQSREFFAVALAVFRSVAERSPHDVIFAEYLFQWSETMLSHETEEVCRIRRSLRNMLANQNSVCRPGAGRLCYPWVRAPAAIVSRDCRSD